VRIGQKIILGFIVIALLFGLAGSVHVAQLMQTKTQIDRVVYGNLGELEAAEEVFNLVQDTHFTILQLLEDSGDRAHEGEVDRISQTRDSIKNNLDEAKAAISSLEKLVLEQIVLGDTEGEDDELREIQLLKGQVNLFSDLTDNLAALLEASEHKTAQAFSKKNILPITLTVQALVSDLEMDAQEEIEAALVDTGVDIQKNIRASIIMIVLAFIAAIVLGWYVSSSISANVIKVHKATTQLGKGKLSTRIDVNSNDEIAQIATDINQMAEGLREVIVSRDDLAKEVSERRKAEKISEESEEKYHNLLEMSRVGIIVHRHGKILFANSYAAQKIGSAGVDELIDRDIVEFIHPEDLPAVMQRVENMMVNGVGYSNEEERYISKDGQIIDVEVSAKPINYEGKPAILVVVQDITDRKQAEESLLQSRENLRDSLIGTVVAISKAVEARDPYTAGHQQRVSRLARTIAQTMGLDRDQVEGVRMGATIHDIGKIQLPAEILTKPSVLSEIEFKIVKAHAQAGYEILKDVKFPWPVADIAHQHHERMDGTGYPQGLKGDEICLEARIVAVADVVEAIASHRPYRASLGLDAALEEITAHRGEWYDPEVVDACLKLFKETPFDFDKDWVRDT